MVFQNYALYPHMSVFNNMAYGLQDTPHAESGDRSKVDEAAEILELDELLERDPRQLPAGSASGWPWAAPSCASPRCSCSTSRCRNLDAKLRVKMRIEIRKLAAKLGITSIYVTHDQVEAMTLADR